MVKRYPSNSAWPALEWECLTFAARAPIPSPTPLALDQDGEWFGSPSIAMEVLPGRPDLKPVDVHQYVEDVVRALTVIHATPITNATGALRRPHSTQGWTTPDRVPDGLIVRETAERMLEAIGVRLSSAATGGTVLNHGDFHPGNLLWRRGRLSGVVDWSYARVGIRWWEVAYMRMEVALLVGVRAADVLLDRYEAAVGEESPDQAVWDLVCLYNAHRAAQQWLVAYREQGRRDLTLATIRRRLTYLARRALSCLDS